MSCKATILFSGMIAAQPGHGGATWAVLQYVLGLRGLGHDVFFVEPIDPSALRPGTASLAESDNARYFREVTAEFSFQDKAALLLNGSEETVGIPYEDLRRISRRADLLINISGSLADERLMAHIPKRAYLDLDPAFIQLWNDIQGIDMRFAAHTHFLTIGLAIGSPECPVPTCGLSWIKTLQPIDIQHWPATDVPGDSAVTTIGNWRGYGSIEHNGVHYGQKAHSFRDFVSLPALAAEDFLLALRIHPDEKKDLEAIRANRWQLVDPEQVANTPASYRHFIQSSKGEFGIAKSGYVASRCGWFSDRSVCYLASARPVIAQDTGFSRFLPVGEGLLSFATMDDVLHAIEEIRSAPERHSRRAREIALEYFDSDRVLSRMLDQLL